jgi:hypothetical protein
MSPALRAAAAQVSVEVKIRLRSTGTLVALVSLLVLGFLWMPDPNSRMTSISWPGPSGHPQSSLFTTAYVGTAAALLAGIFLSLGGFYFVAGSIRRDRERGIGAIVAATPVSSAAYLGGHWAAHAAYLSLLSVMMLAVGLVRFVQFGQGPFDAGALVLPLVLVAAPAACVLAALTVLFDVTPGLRGRGGLVLFFFVAIFLVSLPAAWSHGGRDSRLPLVDPMGMAALNHLIQSSLPAEVRGSISSGLIIHDAPVLRVPWPGLTFTGAFLASRFSTLFWVLPPLGLALLFFDRFDPARLRSTRTARKDRAGTAEDAVAGTEPQPTRSLSSLTAVHPRPGLGRAMAAEVRLIWHGAKLLRWLLVPTALVAAVLPAEPGHLMAWIYLLLVVPAISELGAREDLAGTAALIASQPGVPASRVLWKAGAVALFVGGLALPLVVRTTLASPVRGLALLAGLLFVAAFATAAGSLTGGGRLFSGAYLVVWYAAFNRAPGFDFCGFSTSRGTAPFAWLSAGLVLLALAAWVEHARRSQGGTRR